MGFDESAEIAKQLNKTNEKITEISKQQVILTHEYRRTTDAALKLEIKKKWDKLHKKVKALEKKREQTIIKQSEVDFKKRWDVLKPMMNICCDYLT